MVWWKLKTALWGAISPERSNSSANNEEKSIKLFSRFITLTGLQYPIASVILKKSLETTYLCKRQYQETCTPILSDRKGILLDTSIEHEWGQIYWIHMSCIHLFLPEDRLEYWGKRNNWPYIHQAWRKTHHRGIRMCGSFGSEKWAKIWSISLRQTVWWTHRLE